MNLSDLIENALQNIDSEELRSEICRINLSIQREMNIDDYAKFIARLVSVVAFFEHEKATQITSFDMMLSSPMLIDCLHEHRETIIDLLKIDRPTIESPE